MAPVMLRGHWSKVNSHWECSFRLPEINAVAFGLRPAKEMQKTHFDKLSASKEHRGMHTENTMVTRNAAFDYQKSKKFFSSFDLLRNAENTLRQAQCKQRTRRNAHGEHHGH